MASKQEPNWQPGTVFDFYKRIQDEFIISIGRRHPYEPIMIYFRGMLQTGSDTRVKGAVNYQFEQSRLSNGIKCATQGCEYF